MEASLFALRRAGAELIQPYIKNWDCFWCPSQPRAVLYAGAAPGNIRRYSYSRQLGYFNGAAGHATQPWGPFIESQLAQPAETINMIESDSCARPGPRYEAWPGSNVAITWTNVAYAPSMRHMDGSNFLFYDGHVKWGKRDTFPAKMWSMDDD